MEGGTVIEPKPPKSSRFALASPEVRIAPSVLSADFGGQSRVSFDGYGVPSAGGSAVVQVGQTQKTVWLDAATGKATVQ